MSDAVKVGFVAFSAAPRGVLVVFCDDALKFGEATRKALGKAADTVKRAAAANQFKGKSGSTLDIPAPDGIKAERLIVVGVGKAADIKEKDFLKFGGVTAGKLNAASESVTVIAELPEGAMQGDAAAAIASGIRLRAYKFDRYKTKKKDGENGALRADVSIAVEDVAAARKAFAPASHVVDGVVLARELVNEPPNVLYPVEFARRASQLKKLGVEVEVLDVKAMKKLGMGALLGVSQGSTQPGRTVIMRWNGGKKGDQPVAFVGKGVCFDTGGISIKGAASMEDMKGDMGGAACVVGLMHALAARKAKVNVVGAIGLVENMPAYSVPSATMIAPVSVARSTMNLGLNFLATYQSTSASTSRPSASVLMISMVCPDIEVTISPGRWALPSGMFSTRPMAPTALTFALRPASACISPTTQAAPPMSPFISSMLAAPLMEMPPVSKQTPLPTKATG